MASREFRNDPRRQNLEKLNKRAELYILQTAKKPEAVKTEAVKAEAKTSTKAK